MTDNCCKHWTLANVYHFAFVQRIQIFYFKFIARNKEKKKFFKIEKIFNFILFHLYIDSHSDFCAILEKDLDLYGKDHSILYAGSKSKNADILNALMKLKNANVLLETERNADEEDWGIFVCNICESGCSNLSEKILEITDTPMHVDELEDGYKATPLMR